MEIKREKSLYNIFIRYLVSFCTLSIVLIFSLIAALSIALANDIIKPANYVQNQVEKLKRDVNEGLEINENNIPYPSKYVFLDNKDKIIKTNFNEEELKELSLYLKEKNFNSKYVYSQIPLKNGMCVVKYDIKAHFTSNILNDLIPYPEDILIIIFIIGFIGIAVIMAIKFEKKLKKELYPLKASTEKIKNQDLDFEITPSDIKEFNEVLISIWNMKNALKESLEEQWRIEEEKKNQVCSLAHDIKTPITIIKGNAELLNESKIQEEDREFIGYIINNADKIERYVSILMNISKSDIDKDEVKENINTDEFLEALKSELYILCSLKNIKTSIKISYESNCFVGNKELLMRAIINIISNAVDYSPINSEIELVVYENDSKLIFTVKDLGKGFNDDGLKNATNQFYMEASERKVGKHYGMGLYIAESVAKKHGGFIILKNREDKSGAEVSLAINIK